MRAKRKRSGFTLVELSTAIVILGILAGLSVPTYRAAVAKAKRTEGLIQLKSFWEAQEAYFAEHGQWYAKYIRSWGRYTFGYLYIPAGKRYYIKELGIEIPEGHRYAMWCYWYMIKGRSARFYTYIWASGRRWDIDGDRYFDEWMIDTNGKIRCIFDDISNSYCRRR